MTVLDEVGLGMGIVALAVVVTESIYVWLRLRRFRRSWTAATDKLGVEAVELDRELLRFEELSAQNQLFLSYLQPYAKTLRLTSLLLKTRRFAPVP